MDASGSLPMSSELTSSMIDEFAFLALTASSILLRKPVTTTSWIGWSAGAVVVLAGWSAARALVAAANRMVVTVELMLSVEHRAAGRVALRFFTRRLLENPIGASRACVQTRDDHPPEGFLVNRPLRSS